MNEDVKNDVSIQDDVEQSPDVALESNPDFSFGEEKYSDEELAHAALGYAVDENARASILADYHQEMPSISFSKEEEMVEVAHKEAETLPSPWYTRVTKEQALALGKSVAGAVSSVLGIKSLYSVPEYFRERFALRGLQIGDVEIEKGLADTGATLASESRLVRARASGRSQHIEHALDLAQDERISNLVEGGDRDLSEHRENEYEQEGVGESGNVEEYLESRPAPVRESIARLNQKLAMTKEGGMRGSDARNTLARILRESRNADDLDKEQVRADITEVLDTHLEQKVNGLEATKEALNSLLVGSGAYALRPLMYVSMDATGFLQEAHKIANREHINFNHTFVAKRFAEHAKNFLLRLRGKDEKSAAGIGQRIVSQGTAIATLAKYVGITSTATLHGERLAEDFEKLTDFSIEHAPAHFSGNIDRMAEGIRNMGSNVGGFFMQESNASETLESGSVIPVGVGEKAWSGALEAASRQEYQAGKHGVMVRSLTDTVYGLAGSGATPAEQREVWEALRAEIVESEGGAERGVVKELDSFFKGRSELSARQEIPAANHEQAGVDQVPSVNVPEHEIATLDGHPERMVERTEVEIQRMEQLRDALHEIAKSKELTQSQQRMLEEAESIIHVTKDVPPLPTEPTPQEATLETSSPNTSEAGRQSDSTVSNERIITPDVSPVAIQRMWDSMEHISQQGLVRGLEHGKIFQSIKDTVLGEAKTQFGNGARPEEQRAVWRVYYEKVPQTLKEHPSVQRAHSFFETRVRPPQ